MCVCVCVCMCVYRVQFVLLLLLYLVVNWLVWRCSSFINTLYWRRTECHQRQLHKILMTAWKQHNVLTSAKNDIVNLSLWKEQIFSGWEGLNQRKNV